MKAFSSLRGNENAPLVMQFFPKRKRLRCIVIVTVASFALMGTSRATDDCQQTSQDALGGCQSNANGDRSIAIGKCDNISDPTAHVACVNQVATDFQAAMQTCQDEFNARQAACQRLGPAPYDPVIDPANFVRGVDNPYFPLPPGRTLVYEGQTVDGFEHDEFIITHKTKVIQGVRCVQVHDIVYLDGVLAEDTLDWFAQDRDGNVWYFGENTGELVDGRYVTLDGTFTAGVNGDKPGIVMKAHSQIGDFYRQEFALDNAEDFAEVLALNATVKVPAGTFRHCLQTQETTPLETSLLEQKFYAPGIGSILTVNSNNGDKTRLVQITTNPQ
jgi:hypothetical protein